MRLIVITIYENAHGQSVANLLEDEETSNTKYFESVEEIRKNLNPRFPGVVVWLDIETLETGTV